MFGIKLEKLEKNRVEAVDVPWDEAIIIGDHIFDVKIDRVTGQVVATSRNSKPDLYRIAVNRGENPRYKDYYTHIRKPEQLIAGRHIYSGIWDSIEELRQAIEDNNFIID